jgi:hypothetical protein
MRIPPIVILLAACPLLAHAGRPLASDDAGTADPGTCQVEAWGEKAGSERAWVVAPACGLLPGVELGADYTQPRPRDPVRAEAGLALKWVPESWKAETGLGALNFGLKFAAAWAKPTAASWQGSGSSVLGLATLEVNDAVTVHANLGLARDRESATNATVLNLALVWTPSERTLVFAETQANSRREVFGGTVNSVGARWWLVKDQLGLDLTASRESVSGAKTGWTLGLGWYGIGL